MSKSQKHYLKNGQEYNGPTHKMNGQLHTGASHTESSKVLTHTPSSKGSNYTKPSLREIIKDRIMAGSKGGKPGQWSARKAQLTALEYKKSGGEYSSPKTKSQKSLSKWTKEDWGTKSGKPSIKGEDATGERYLPKKSLEKLSSKEYAATTRAKREGIKEGKQFVKQPESIVKKLKGKYK